MCSKQLVTEGHRISSEGESLILKQREDGRDAFYMLFNQAPWKATQFLKEEVIRFANDHGSQSVTGGWGGSGEAVLATYLPFKGTQRERHEAGWLRALCISPPMEYMCVYSDSFPCFTGTFLLPPHFTWIFSREKPGRRSCLPALLLSSTGLLATFQK